MANILGMNFSGFVAWWLWRTIYLLKLPRFEKKVRVALDWTLDLFFTKDIVRHHRLRLRQGSSADVSVPPTAEPSGAETAGPTILVSQTER